jgi:hypothetical protein
MADNGGEVAIPARLYTKHAKAGLGSVERDPLNDAGEHFAVGPRGGRRHGHGRIIPMRPVRGERVWAGGGRSCGLGPKAKGSEPSTGPIGGGKGIPTFRLRNQARALKCQRKKLVE